MEEIFYCSKAPVFHVVIEWPRLLPFGFHYHNIGVHDCEDIVRKHRTHTRSYILWPRGDTALLHP